MKICKLRLGEIRYCSMKIHLLLLLLCFNLGLLLFGCSRDLLPVSILSLVILANHPASTLVTCSSHSLLLLSTHSFIDWIPQDTLICWLLIVCIFVLPTVLLVLSSDFLPTIVSYFYFYAPASSAYATIGLMVSLYIFVFCFLSSYLQTRLFKQPATLAAF